MVGDFSSYCLCLGSWLPWGGVDYGSVPKQRWLWMDEAKNEPPTANFLWFREVKAPCVQFLGVLESQKNIDVKEWRGKMKDSLKEIEDKILVLSLEHISSAECFDYLSFPLMLALRQLHSQQNTKMIGDSLLAVLQTLYLLLYRSSLTNVPPWTSERSINIIQNFCDSILTSIESSSEEAKLITIKILDLIFKKEPPSVHSLSLLSGGALGTEKNIFDRLTFKLQGRQLLGFMLFVVVEIVTKEKLRETRIIGLQLIQNLFEKVSIHTICSFLPGVVSELVKIITGDYKQGSKVIACAINCLSSVIKSVFFDKGNTFVLNETKSDPLENLRKFQSKTKESLSTPTKLDVNMELKDLVLSLDMRWQWIEQARDRIAVVLTSLFATNKEYLNHPNPRVTEAIIKCVGSIANECKKTLSEFLPIFIEVLVIHYKSSNPTLSHLSTEFLERLSLNLPMVLANSTRESLQNRLFSLSRIVRKGNDEETLVALKSIVGLLWILKENQTELDLLFISSYQSIFLCLFQVLEFELFDLSEKLPRDIGNLIKSQKSLTNDDLPSQSSTVEHFKKIFKHFRSDQVKFLLTEFCQMLGSFGNMDLFLDFLIPVIRDSNSKNYKQAIFLVNQLCLGACEPKKLTKNIVKTVLNSYLEHFLWKSQESTNLENLNDRIFTVCLFLEGIGMIFSSFLTEDFEELIHLIIYPVAGKLGDASSSVSQTALNCISHISNSCGYSSIDEFFAQNIDYVIDSVCVNLKHFDEHPETPQVLKGILQFANSAILPLLEDTIENVFTCIDVHHSSSSAITFLNVLQVIVKILSEQLDKKFSQLSPKDITQDLTRLTSKQRDKIQEFLLKILEKCQFFVGSELKEAKILVYQILLTGIPCIENQDHLLPLLHKLWNPFVRRISDQDTHIVTQSLEVLTAMINTSAEFLKSRVKSDLWPKLSVILKNHSTIPTKISQTKFLKSNKTILSLLQFFTHLLRSKMFFGLHDYFLQDLALATLPFLHQNFLEEIQNEAVILFKLIAAEDCDFVWYILVQQGEESFVKEKMTKIQFKRSHLSKDISTNSNQILNFVNKI